MKSLLALLALTLLPTSAHAEMDMVKAGYASAITTIICRTRLSLAERKEFNQELTAFMRKKENANKSTELVFGMDQAEADWEKAVKMHIAQARFCDAALKIIRDY